MSVSLFVCTAPVPTGGAWRAVLPPGPRLQAAEEAGDGQPPLQLLLQPDGTHVSVVMTCSRPAQAPPAPPASGPPTGRPSSHPVSSSSSSKGQGRGRRSSKPPPPQPRILGAPESYVWRVGVDPWLRDVFVGVDQDDGRVVGDEQDGDGRPPSPSSAARGQVRYCRAGVRERARKLRQRLARSPDLRA